MISYSHSSNLRLHRPRLGLFQCPPRFSVDVSGKNFTDSPISRFYADSYFGVKSKASKFNRTGFYQLRNLSEVRAFDQDSFDFDIPSLDNFGGDEGTTGYMLPYSDGEDSDPDIILHPVSDVDLPTAAVHNSDALTITTHRLGMLSRGHKRHRYLADQIRSFRKR